MTMHNPSTAAAPDSNLDAVIGENIHRLMWASRESQSKLAPLWGMTQAALSRKLRGDRPWFAAEIDAAARHFRVTRDALFTRLPHLDSNQEPIGSKVRPLRTLEDHRRAKEEAHKAVSRVRGIQAHPSV